VLNNTRGFLVRIVNIDAVVLFVMRVGSTSWSMFWLTRDLALLVCGLMRRHVEVDVE
jgi:hypothetical protein